MAVISRRGVVAGVTRAACLILAILVALTGLGGCQRDHHTDDVCTDVLRYVAAGVPSLATADPHSRAINDSDTIRFSLLYDVLTAPGPDGAIQPRLAESWEADDSFLRWRFTIRDQARFTDGRPVRSHDVLYSLRRIESKSRENRSGIALFDLSVSTVIDDRTVELVARQPLASAERLVASTTFIVPQGMDDFTTTPVGSGPFTLVSANEKTAVLARNDYWWGTQPALKRIEIYTQEDPAARARAVISGKADVASDVEPTAISGNRRVQRIHRPQAAILPLVMRLDQAPVDLPEVREAIRVTINRPEAVRAVFGSNGIVGEDLLSPEEASRPEELQTRSHDPDQGKDLLAKVGYTGGITIRVDTTTLYPGMRKAASALALSLADAAISAEVRIRQPDEYFATIAKKRDCYIGYFDGSPFIDVGVSLMSNSPANEGAWRNPQWDTAFLTALGTSDVTIRDQMLADLQGQVHDDGGYVVWGVSDAIDVARDDIRGLPSVAGKARFFIDQVTISR